jgi:hypothetical protein
MAKSYRNTFALDSFGLFRPFWLVWCFAEIEGYGNPLDIKGRPSHRCDLRGLARLRLRGGRSQTAEGDKDLKQVTENETLQPNEAPLQSGTTSVRC